MCRKIDNFRDILLQSNVVPAELIFSMFSLMKLHIGLNQRIVIETFEKCANRVQFKQTDKTAENKNAKVYNRIKDL